MSSRLRGARLCAALFVFFPSLLLASGPASPKPQQKTRPASPASSSYTVTVTATRTPTEVRKIGQSVTVITAEEIRALGARDVSEVLQTVPGFSVSRTGSFGGATSVFVRGGESDFNLVLIDGVPVNQAGGSFDFADLTTANIERIEIVRGPGSVLHGAESVTSTIQIITRRGSGPAGGQVRFEAGSFDTRRLSGSLGGEQGRVHYSFGGQYLDSDGFQAFNNNYRKTQLSAQGSFELASGSLFSASARLLDSDFHFPTDFTGRAVDPNDFRTTNELLFQGLYQGLLSERWRTQVQYGFNRRDFKNFTLFDGVDDFFDSEFRLLEHRNYLDWQNTVRLTGRHTLTWGTSWERESTPEEDLSRRSLGFYLQDQFSWQDRLFLTAGIRYDDNDRFQSFTTANLSAGFLLGDQWKLRASVGNGFRAPSFSEIVGFPDFGIRGNPDLAPEKNVATDAGLDFLARDGRSGFSASAFFNHFSDLIEFSFLAAPGEPSFSNIEKAEAKGLEVEGFLMLLDHLRLGGNYTFTHTRVTNAGAVPGGSFQLGRPLLRRPENVAGIYLEFLRHRYRLRLDLKFKGRRDDIQFFPDFSSARVVLPSYLRADLAVTFPLLGLSDSRGALALVVRGENILGRNYQEVAGFDSPGRRLLAGLEVGF